MTFSIIVFVPENKEWCVAVQLKFVSVSTVFPSTQVDVGALAT